MSFGRLSPARDGKEPFCTLLVRALQCQAQLNQAARSEEVPMGPEGSVTDWLRLLQAGDQSASQPLWQRYFQQLVALARAHLRGQSRRVADEEDVALSAFDSFCRAAEQGRFPQLADRDDLWRLLVVLTARKVSHLLRDQRRQKRGGALSPEAVRGEPGEEELEEVVGQEPSPEFAAEVAEQTQRLLDLLDQAGDAELRQMALAKMEGGTVEEIAASLGCAPRTVAASSP
jgi:DNA-directed RNA polymerase specialized sigma24 family protein